MSKSPSEFLSCDRFSRSKARAVRACEHVLCAGGYATNASRWLKMASRRLIWPPLMTCSRRPCTIPHPQSFRAECGRNCSWFEELSVTACVSKNKSIPVRSRTSRLLQPCLTFRNLICQTLRHLRVSEVVVLTAERYIVVSPLLEKMLNVLTNNRIPWNRL